MALERKRREKSGGIYLYWTDDAWTPETSPNQGTADSHEPKQSQ